MATILASSSWTFAFSTVCGTPRALQRPESSSDFSTETVPTRTGWPFWCRSSMSLTTASNFASSVR